MTGYVGDIIYYSSALGLLFIANTYMYMHVQYAWTRGECNKEQNKQNKTRGITQMIKTKQNRKST